MKTIQETKDDVAVFAGYFNWIALVMDCDSEEHLDLYIDEVALRYAKQALDEAVKIVGTGTIENVKLGIFSLKDKI